MILMWKFLYFRTSAAEGTYWGRDPRDIQLSALCPHTQCTSTWTWQKFQPKFGERALGNCVNVISKEVSIAIGAGIAMWRIQNICNKMFLFFGFLWHDCKNCFKNFCQILNEGHGMVWKTGNAAFSQIHTVRYIQYEVRPILQGEKRQIFDIFLFSTRFHICSQAFDMIWFHPSTLTQQHKSLVKIRKSAKRNQNLTLVASLNQLWRNRPVKESVWFLCAMWHPTRPCCWLGFPTLHSNQPFHFKLFAWEKNLLSLMCDIMPDFAGVGQNTPFWFCHHFWNWWYIDARVF